MSHRHVKEREERLQSGYTQKGIVVTYGDKVLPVTTSFIVPCRSARFSPVCLNFASSIKQSPNVKCLINSSCHQEQLCLKWFFLTSLGPIHSFLFFRERISEKCSLFLSAYYLFSFSPTKVSAAGGWPYPLLFMFTSLTPACSPHFGIHLSTCRH